MSTTKMPHCQLKSGLSRLRRVSCAMVAVLLVLPVSARADQYGWHPSSGDWMVASNWGGTLPTSGDTAIIDNGGTANITTTGPVCNTLSVGEIGTDNSMVQMIAGSLSTSTQYIGYEVAGNFAQSGGYQHHLQRFQPWRVYLPWHVQPERVGPVVRWFGNRGHRLRDGELHANGRHQ